MLGRTDTDRLQHAVATDRLGQTLKLAILADLPTWIETLRDGLSRGRLDLEPPAR